MGRIDIRVVEARNLPDTQMIGKPDPYVIVKLEHQSHKTRVIENSLNPKWDEVIKFIVSDPNSAQLRFELWNSNVVSDEFLGCYTLSLNGLFKGVVKDDWYLLQQCKSNAELRIRLLAQDFGLPSPATAAAPPPAQQVGQAHVPGAPVPPPPQAPQPKGPPQQPMYPPVSQPGYPPMAQAPGYQPMAPPGPPGYPPSTYPPGPQPGYAPAAPLFTGPPPTYPPGPPPQGYYPPGPGQGYPAPPTGYPPQGGPPGAGGYPPGYPAQPQPYPPPPPGPYSYPPAPYPPIQYAQGIPPQQGYY